MDGGSRIICVKPKKVAPRRGELNVINFSGSNILLAH